MVRAHRPRHLEPAQGQDARTLLSPHLRPREVPRRPRAARRALGRPGAGRLRRLTGGGFERLAHPGPVRTRQRGVLTVFGPLGQVPRAARGNPRSDDVRRTDRRAGPDVLEPLLYHRPQVLPRPQHHPARTRDRLGQRAPRALRRRARHRRRPALVLAVRVGLPDHDVPPRGGAARVLAQRDADLDPRPGTVPESDSALAARGRRPDSLDHPRAGRVLHRRHRRPAQGRAFTQVDPRRDPDRGRPRGARMRLAGQFLDAPARLRVHEHARLVLRELRPPAQDEAALHRRKLHQPVRALGDELQGQQDPRRRDLLRRLRHGR